MSLRELKDLDDLYRQISQYIEQKGLEAAEENAEAEEYDCSGSMRWDEFLDAASDVGVEKVTILSRSFTKSMVARVLAEPFDVITRNTFEESIGKVGYLQLIWTKSGSVHTLTLQSGLWETAGGILPQDRERKTMLGSAEKVRNVMEGKACPICGKTMTREELGHMLHPPSLGSARVCSNKCYSVAFWDEVLDHVVEGVYGHELSLEIESKVRNEVHQELEQLVKYGLIVIRENEWTIPVALDNPLRPSKPGEKIPLRLHPYVEYVVDLVLKRVGKDRVSPLDFQEMKHRISDELADWF